MRQRDRGGRREGPAPARSAASFRWRAPPVPGGGRGDPARFDNSRPPLRPTAPAGAVPDADIVKAVESVAARKFDYIKTVITTTPDGPETRTLKLIVDEGKKRNLPTITHAVSVIDTLAAVEAMPAVLVHTPHIGRLEEDAAAVKRIAGAGIPMTSTLQVFVPHFGADNTPLFRDAQPFPWDTISSAGQGPVNARLLWEAGISYGYGTDTTWPPRQSLADELRALSLTFSPLDITKIMGQGAARSTLRQDQIGTLEAGKQADLVLDRRQPADQRHRPAEGGDDDQGRAHRVGSPRRRRRAPPVGRAAPPCGLARRDRPGHQQHALHRLRRLEPHRRRRRRWSTRRSTRSRAGWSTTRWRSGATPRR